MRRALLGPPLEGREDLVHPRGRFLLAAGQQVAISVEGHARGRVADLGLDRLEVAVGDRRAPGRHLAGEAVVPGAARPRLNRPRARPPPSCAGRPPAYIEPDGRWVQAATAVVGAAVGAYAGYRLAQSRGWGTFGTVAAVTGGALVGMAAGAVLGHLAVGGGIRVGIHGAHHTFGRFGKLAHVQVNIWMKGVRGSGKAVRIRLGDKLR